MRVTASGGKGMSFMTLETGESLVSVALVDDRGAIVTGTGRGGKAREAQISKRILSGATLHRARRGKVLALSWKAEHIVGCPLNQRIPRMGRTQLAELRPTALRQTTV